MEGRVEYRTGGLDFQPSPILLDNPSGDYGHLQRSLDTLRSLSERNVDFRLNLNQDLRNIDLKSERYNSERSSPMDRNLNGRNMNGLELNLSLERGLSPQDRVLQDHRHLNLDNNLRNLNLDRNMLPQDRLHLERDLNHERNLSLERSLSQERNMSLERSLSSERLNMDSERVLTPNSDRLNSERMMNPNNGDRLIENRDLQQQDINELKYREYKNHLDNLRGFDGRQVEGQPEEGRGTPSTPPTPVSVGENNYQEDKVFGSKAELQLHTQAHMREAKPYKCSQCCKAFANSSYLSQHTRIHLGIKPYRCEICQRKFTQLSHLQQHIRTHTGDKPYKCRHPGCQKAFSQLSNLQSHSRCHQTDKPYKCNSCYKCFSDEPSLLEHIPKHKESKHLKTHICQYCGKSYTQETYLTKHMQKHAERTDKRPPIGTGLGLNPRALDHPYWPKVSPDSADNMHDGGGGGYPGDIPRQILEQNEDLVIIRQQLGQNPPAPPSTPTPNLANSYDASISKSTTNSAFTPINSMSQHLNLNHHQLAPNRPYLYDAISFQKQNSLDLQKSQPSNGFPNQLISLHQIRNYAHQPNAGLMEHSILGLKDK